MKKTLLFLLLLSSFQLLSAQSIAGGEIYYRQISSQKFLVTAHVYRICQYAPLTQLDAFVIAGNHKIQMNFKRIQIQKIPDTCGNPCNIQNQSSNFGFEKHTFIDTVDLNSSKYNSILNDKLCEVKFAIHQPIRHGAGFTVPNINGNYFYLDAMVKICTGNTNMNSPEFSIEPKFIYACNQSVIYSPGPIDSMDFDSLSYSLETPQRDTNVFITYKTGYSKDVPMTPYCPPTPGNTSCKAIPNAKPSRGFYFNPYSSQLQFTPTNCGEQSLIKMKITEWRRDSFGVVKPIGYVCREMLTKTQIVADNNPPYLTNTSVQFSKCMNNSLCFTKSLKDNVFLPKQTVPDTVNLEFNYGIPQATYTITNPNDREKNFDFCMPANTYKNSGVFNFAIKATDKKCNVNLTSINFTIFNYGQTNFNIKKSLGACNLYKYEISTPDSFRTLYGTVSVYDSKQNRKFSSNQLIDSVYLNKNEPFIIEYSFKDQFANCFTSIKDTVNVSNAIYKGFDTQYIDTTVCASYPSKLSFSPSSTIGLSRFEWYKNDTLFSTTDSIVSENIYYPSKYKLVVYGNNGCFSESKRNYFVANVNANLLAYDSEILCTDVGSKVIYASTSALKSPIIYNWKYKNTDTNTFVNQITVPADETFKIYLKATDDRHCIVKDSMLLKYSVNTNTIAADKYSICQDSLVNIFPDSIDSKNLLKYRWNINGKDSSINGLSFIKNIKANTQIVFYSQNKDLCINYDTIDILMAEHPTAQIYFIDSAICWNQLLLVSAQIQPKDSTEFKWYLNDSLLPVQNSFYAVKPDSSGVIRLKLKSKDLCAATVEKSFTVYPKTKIKILNDTFYNSKSLVYLSIDQKLNNYNWFNGSTKDTIYYWAYQFGTPGKHKIWINGYDSNFCQVSDTLDIYTDRFVSIKNTFKENFKIYPNPSNGMVNIYSPETGMMQIFDSKSVLVMEGKIELGINFADLHQLPSGVYLIVINQMKQNIVIQH
jgi:hypothetical protein